MDTAWITLKSPAKVNLFLRVLKRRPDGYHALASLFQAVDLCDLLRMRLASKDRLTVINSPLSTDRSNLVWKAIDLFRAKSSLEFAVECELEKNIPMEAGLGGGSSNAATALFGMNALTGFPFSEEKLLSLASEIGSDVPFFFSSGVAYCTGRGEIVNSLSPLPPSMSVGELGHLADEIWLFKQQAGLSTPAVFRALRLASLPMRDPDAALAAFLEGRPCYFNDLEHSAFSLMPELLTRKLELQALGFKDVFLAGSGSSLVGIGAPPKDYAALVPGFVRRTHRLHRAANAWY